MGSSRGGSSWRWGRAWCWALVLYCGLSIALPAQPSEPWSSEQRKLIENAIARFESIKSESDALKLELESSRSASDEKQRRIEQLLTELSALRLALETARSDYETSNSATQKRIAALLSEVSELQNSLEKEQRASANSSASWRLALEQAIKERGRAVLRTALIAGGAGILVGGLVTALVMGLGAAH